MRGFWRALAYMAENNAGFGDEIDRRSGFVPAGTALEDDIRIVRFRPDASAFFLAKQPTRPILIALDQLLRSNDGSLRLSPYELAEVNRISYIGKTQAPVHKDLREYWRQLGPIAPASRDSNGFMEAVGALAIDRPLRDGLRGTPPGNPFLQTMFDVSQVQEDGLRDNLAANSPAEHAAIRYFELAWGGGGQCLTIAKVWDDPMHPNI